MVVIDYYLFLGILKEINDLFCSKQLLKLKNNIYKKKQIQAARRFLIYVQ